MQTRYFYLLFILLINCCWPAYAQYGVSLQAATAFPLNNEMLLYKSNAKFNKPLAGGGIGMFYNVTHRFRALLNVSYLKSSQSFKNSGTTTLSSQIISVSPEIAYTFLGSSEDSRLSLSALVGANLDFNLLKEDFSGEFPMTDNYGNPIGSLEYKYSRSQKYTPKSLHRAGRPIEIKQAV
jgi:hypothetical protein